MAVDKPITASFRQEGLNRRKLLMGLPFAGAALAIPAMAEADERRTQILRLFHQHQAILDAAAKHISATASVDEELERLFYCRSDKIEEEMMALPCTCAADFAAKVIVDSARGGRVSDWETGAIWKEARALTGGAA